MVDFSQRGLRILSSRGFLIGVLVLAAALRVWHVLELRELPLFERLIVDSAAYDAWAQRIAAGDWLGSVPGRPFAQDPLYPYMLAAVYRVFGRDLLLVRLIQVAFGVATCGLVAALGRSMRDAAAGNLGALLLAIYRPSIFQEGEFEKTALGVFLATAALVLFLRRSTSSRLAAGVVLGLAVMTRGNLLLLVPFGIVYLARRGAWRSAAAWLLGLAIAVAPATLRNYHIAHEWVLTTAWIGQNLYTGNNPANPDGAYRSVPFARPYTEHEVGDFLREAERRTGRSLSAREASSFWLRETVHGMSGSPAFAAGVMVKKLGLFWSDVEVPDAWDMAFISRYSRPLRWPLGSFWLLLGLAVLGVVPATKTEAGRLVLGYVVLYGASVVLFFILSRYRLHVVPPLAALAGVGLMGAVDRFRAGGARSIALPVAAALVAATFSAFAFPSYRRESTNSTAALAEIYEERGDYAAARHVLDEAFRRVPEDPRLLCALGKLCLRRRDAAGALDYTGRCVQANPYTPDGWYLLGLAREASGDAAGAREAYEHQLKVVPGHGAAAGRLGR